MVQFPIMAGVPEIPQRPSQEQGITRTKVRLALAPHDEEVISYVRPFFQSMQTDLAASPERRGIIFQEDAGAPVGSATTVKEQTARGVLYSKIRALLDFIDKQ